MRIVEEEMSGKFNYLLMRLSGIFDRSVIRNDRGDHIPREAVTSFSNPMT